LCILFLLFISQFIFYQQISTDILYETTKEKLGSFNNQFNFLDIPFLFLNIGTIERFKGMLPYIGDIKFLSLYLISALIIFLPLIFILKKIKISNHNFKFFQTILSILPFFLLLFLASDWGRWIYIMALILLGVNLQFKIKNINEFDHGRLLNLAILTFFGFYLFFYNLSHCCIKNLFFYGMNQNFQLLINLLLDNVNITEHIKY
jgi:hypothetical protein